MQCRLQSNKALSCAISSPDIEWLRSRNIAINLSAFIDINGGESILLLSHPQSTQLTITRIVSEEWKISINIECNEIKCSVSP